MERTVPKKKGSKASAGSGFEGFASDASVEADMEGLEEALASLSREVPQMFEIGHRDDVGLTLIVNVLPLALTVRAAVSSRVLETTVGAYLDENTLEAGDVEVVQFDEERAGIPFVQWQEKLNDRLFADQEVEYTTTS